MNENNQFLGIVKNGQLQLLQPEDLAGTTVRLTGIQMQMAISPEMAELDLSKYERKALMVLGRDGGGWIYSAEVVDQVGPILAAVVQKVFGK